MSYKFTMVQFHTDTINKPEDNIVTRYYNKIWEQEHYMKPDAFWELPKWVGELSYCLNMNSVEHDFRVLTSPKTKLKSDFVFGSVLECNKDLYIELVKNNPDTIFIFGGYITTTKFAKNVCWYDSIEKAMHGFEYEYRYGIDWSVFKGYECIPRLTLSYGCSHRCKFCTINNTVTSLTIKEIEQQVFALRGLIFDLVYIDDKTFGQSPTHVFLDHMATMIREFNPDFTGFIIQTTAMMVKKIDYWDKLPVYAAEIGVETFNDNILRELKKPATTEWITDAEEILVKNSIKYIPNIVVGFTQETGETYINTLNYLTGANMLHANVYNLAIYEDAELSSDIKAIGSDFNEFVSEKSFNTEEKNVLNGRMMNEICKLILKKLKDEEIHD